MKIYTNFVNGCVRFLSINHTKNRITNLKVTMNLVKPLK